MSGETTHSEGLATQPILGSRESSCGCVVAVTMPPYHQLLKPLEQRRRLNGPSGRTVFPLSTFWKPGQGSEGAAAGDGAGLTGGG